MKKLFTIVIIISAALGVYGMGHHMTKAQSQQLQQMQIPPEPQFQSFHAIQPPQQSGDVTDRIVNIFLDQGVIGAMLILMFFWFYKQEQTASSERTRMNEKFEELIRESFDKTDLIEMKQSIAAINHQILNLEREIETLKDFILSGRIGGNRG